METKNKLKPCPFCKNTDCVVDSTGYGLHYVTCLKCEARGPLEDTAEDAETAWNKRAEAEE